MFAGISSKLMLIQAVVIVLLLGMGYWYYNHSQYRIQQLSEDKAKLETAVQLQTETIVAQQAAAQRQNTESFNLQQNMQQAEITRRELEQRLRRMDLQMRARTNAMDLEQQVNRDISQAFRDIENLTQSRNRTTPVTTLTPARPTTASNASNVQPPPSPPVRGAPR